MSDRPSDGVTQFPGPGTSIPAPIRLEMYAAMWRARVFEKRAYDPFMQGLVKGTNHPGTGQEAVAAIENHGEPSRRPHRRNRPNVGAMKTHSAITTLQPMRRTT